MKKGTLLFTLTLLISISLSRSGFSQGSCYSDQSDFYWKINESLYGSKRLSDCHPGAYYNCHGFVISYFENGCTAPSWISTQVPAPYTCPNSQGVKSASAFQNSGKYVQVCTESTANIAFYELVLGDSHSAVKEVTGGGAVIKYLSKYGSDGPLVAHNLTGSWYHLTGRVVNSQVQFWSYLGLISGNPNIVGLNPVTFNVYNIPGVNYSWSIPTGFNKIYISSGANQSSVTLTPTHSGTAVLRLNVSSSCGSVKTQEITLNIQTNVCLEGTFNNAGNNGQNLNTLNRVSVGGVSATVTCPNATSFTWQRTSGNISGWIAYGATVSFTMTSGGSISFSVTARNGSTTLSTRNVTFHNFGSFRTYPNPSTTSLAVDLNQELDFGIVIESFDGSFKREVPKYKGGSAIDISDLEAGDYVLSIFFEGKLIHKRRVLVSRN
jgi:hypothetical protein